MLTFHDRGVWFEIINIMHESAERGVLMINGAPMPEEAIARLLGLDKQIFNQTLTTLLSYGVAKRRDGDGAIYCKRMVNDEKITQIRREAGNKGGNPALLNQNPTTPVKQIPTPSSSSSTSSSTSIDSLKKKFVPPSLDEWSGYGATLSPPYEKQQAENTHNFYSAKGWKVGNQPMRDWKAALRTCHGRWKSETAATPGTKPAKPKLDPLPWEK
jgi:hypothetical protein